MADRTSLGDRMKRYEEVTRAVLPARTYTILRVDGRAFHTLLRHARKPFDDSVANAMGAVAQDLCAEISGARFAYTQSDECSVLLTDFETVGTQPWFGGVIQKMVSVAAARASVTFSSYWNRRDALFDARVFTIPSSVEVANYFVWRQRDALRNSVSMAAQAHFSHKELQGVSSAGMQEMLWSRKDVNWNDYPARHRRGQLCWKVPRTEPISVSEGPFVRKLPGPVTYNWVTAEAPRFAAEPSNPLAGLIPPLPDLVA